MASSNASTNPQLSDTPLRRSPSLLQVVVALASHFPSPFSLSLSLSSDYRNPYSGSKIEQPFISRLRSAFSGQVATPMLLRIATISYKNAIDSAFSITPSSPSSFALPSIPAKSHQTEGQLSTEITIKINWKKWLKLSN